MNLLWIKPLVIAFWLKGSLMSFDHNSMSKTVIDTAVDPVKISTNKSHYLPGSKIIFRLSKSLPATTAVRYICLGKLIKSQPLFGTSWSWVVPFQDFTGYLVELAGNVNGIKKIYATIAVDVSSNPARFPRNGFLSAYGKLDDRYQDSVMRILNRYHINYLQFQDWEYEHHKPLAGTVTKPDKVWKDIANRDNYRITVQQYIALAHQYGMLALHYNLIYGALDNGGAEGVFDKWRLFTDKNHKYAERVPLPVPPFKSGLCIMNPADTGWQRYLAHRTAEAWQVYDFDGYQVDQLGDLNKPLYDYSGQPVYMAQAFGSFITAMKRHFPQKRIIMNAVSQYGQQSICGSPVDFLYTEVWPPDTGYKDLARIILFNDSLSSGNKKTVMPAYMDYDLAERGHYFNTAGVLLSDAVIFAFGGSHLELGEHMLGKEYFPNDKLKMHDDLKTAMICYYDFLTGYENLLRDGGKFYKPALSSTDTKLKLNDWPPQMGQISLIGKHVRNKDVIHLINFNNANTLNWRDNKGTQNQPVIIHDLRLKLKSNKKIKQIWMASPDINSGAPEPLKFTRLEHTITFTLPSLQYWDMLTIEY